MSFKSAALSSWPEIESRKANGKGLLKFGVEYLDDALRGIFKDDLVLLGAPSGMGKTQLCCNIAMANMQEGKKVHYIALEAGEFEVERRLKFPLILERFLADKNAPRLGKKLNYTDWLLGDHLEALKVYEEEVAAYFETAFRDLFLFYKQKKFGMEELIDAVLSCSDDTDLIMVDHIHFFDFDDDNEHRAIREIAKTVRQLTQHEQKPIVLVAHLRKKDRGNDELVPGMEEFHGTSDLYKIATKVITMAPGRPTSEGFYETFFRIPKSRIEGSVTRYSGRELFDPKTGGYQAGRYLVGWAEQKRSTGFAALADTEQPEWSRVRRVVLSAGSQGKRVVKNYAPRKETLPRMPYGDQGD